MNQTNRMNQMDKETACLLLDIPILSLNESLLRKKYKLACLKYHPDKGNQDSHLFLQVKEAYDFLQEDLKNQDQNHDKYDVLNQFDSDTLKYYVSILYFFKENIDHVINPVLNHLKQFEYYELHPTLEQLFNKSLYILNDIYIPLWHHELTIHHYKIKIIPDLPEYIDIDMNNNVHVYLTTTSRSFTFVLAGISFLINGYNKEEIFIGKGIPIIQEKIYDIKLSDVIFHIESY
jgi:hypothetical protein